MNKPLVSIILPVYNGATYLHEAISSILAQDFSDIELIAINDASKDESDKIIKGFNDSRIRHISNSTNLGLATALNLGIEESKGKFIARMDQDDIADPRRLRLQIATFEKDKSLGICGSNFHAFGGDEIYNSNYPLSHDKIFTNLLFYNCIAHPTVMFRKSVFTENRLNYIKEFDWAEDFDLWTRARHITKMTNIKKPLLRYRINTGSMTLSGQTKMHKTINSINRRSLFELGIDASDLDLDLHHKIAYNLIDPNNRLLLKKTGEHLWKIILHNREVKIYNEVILKDVISKYWHFLLINMSDALRSEQFLLEISLFLNSEKAIQWKLKTYYIKNQLKSIVTKWESLMT
jgi:glycosyltransferase involved in cell wall biosynthesis